MNEIRITPVKDAKERRTFLEFPWKLYGNDPLWVPPLYGERAKLIDPRKGPFFTHGQAEFFIAWRDGQPVGTICTAIDHELNQARGLKECVFGFFECIEDATAARVLFEFARGWAASHGQDWLYGPFNLDYEDAYGVLIEGWDQPPALLCGHSPPYYQTFFEDYGFLPARGDNLAYALDLIDNPAIAPLERMADRVRRQRNFTIRSGRFERWEEEIDLIYPLINMALAHLPDARPWPRETLQHLFAPFRKIADPDLILMAEDGDRLIGFLPGVPNLNEALIHANGLRRPWDYLSLWRWLQRPAACLAIKSVLVYPEYWGSGAAILLFDEMAKRARAKGYRWLDLSLTSADNPRTPVLAERFGGRVYKRYRVYRLKI